MPKKTEDPSKLIGRTGLYRIPTRGRSQRFTIIVIVTDWRKRYGRLDLQVKPADGVGSAWVSRRAVKFITA